MKKLSIGLLGYGTVGKAVATLLQNQENMILHAIFRRPGKDLGFLMTESIEELIDNPSIDTIVEALGGVDPAYSYLKRALLNHKHVVTANKALVNMYGDELNKLAQVQHVSFLFSAACGGGIPYLSTLLETQKKERITQLGGIFNGTTNFIIDQMERERSSFSQALKRAQDLGYAEADPASDLEGIDTMFKLRLAVAVAMHLWVAPESIDVAGITQLSAFDIAYFQSKGWSLRLTGRGQLDNGQVVAYVEPTLVLNTSAYCQIWANNNLVWFMTASNHKTELIGQGAGGVPTATNILRDLQQISQQPMWMLTQNMTTIKAHNQAYKHAYYVRIKKEMSSPFLDSNTVERNETVTELIYLTTEVEIELMHLEAKRLRQSGEIFFAGINLGGHL